MANRLAALALSLACLAGLAGLAGCGDDAAEQAGGSPEPSASAPSSEAT
jgi:hypothetical protein